MKAENLLAVQVNMSYTAHLLKDMHNIPRKAISMQIQVLQPLKFIEADRKSSFKFIGGKIQTQ